MAIRYKSIENERMEDAPFVGALICAHSCAIGCKGCFNQDLKKMPSEVNTASKIVELVLEDPFNKGLILGGLEWSEQPEELIELVQAATQKNLPVIIFTGHTLEAFYEKVPRIKKIEGEIYIKYGGYNEALLEPSKVVYGVKLATSNQGIVLLKATG
ncbi:4Fe-4S cluster-binding domain-containing protein [Fusibacter sp. 3D3]|uniref:4Fe-4S cluster-binding domain-containing protein n=1 Tax=Fusibacter sp. 3D3 TaxID=1048380 RepID=UPI000853721F|nr:4Fe-4S cluster-binding domain-containing protein [Fusibacter sp. 3D3]GAU75910.1 hypothetical protein F3D3_0506 [Fusibacter sp. 3D3]